LASTEIADMKHEKEILAIFEGEYSGPCMGYSCDKSEFCLRCTDNEHVLVVFGGSESVLTPLYDQSLSNFESNFFQKFSRDFFVDARLITSEFTFYLLLKGQPYTITLMPASAPEQADQAPARPPARGLACGDTAGVAQGAWGDGCL
jgi:hypothetical protein